MCGIFAIFDARSQSINKLRKEALKCAKVLRHRGPDWNGVYVYPEEPETEQTGANGHMMVEGDVANVVMIHERLSIVDPTSGAQPLFSSDKKLVLCVNGEIYNHKILRQDKSLTDLHEFQTESDCEVIIPLYKKYGVDCVDYLDGMFAFIIWDEEKKEFFAARDHMGIVPLYIGWRNDGGIVIASEMKGLHTMCERFEIFKPGHYVYSKSDPNGIVDFERWYKASWLDDRIIPTNKLDYNELRARLERAVVKRMMSDVPWGVLLSGGLDSSLVSSIATRYAAQEQAAWPKIHSFSIGLKGSPDLAAAQKVADVLGTIHHSMEYTIQEGHDALSDVIYHLETYDVTTIRASTPMYLLARKIKSLGVKMVLSGEGADECLAGYLYFHKAPNKEELHKETINKLKNLHYFDCLRANKAMSAFGVEPRVPFLDKDFLQYVMTLDPDHKMVKKGTSDPRRGMEKHCLRKAFDTPEKPYLPDEILWRQKEQFSDGVGYGWIDSLRDRAEREVTNMQWASRAKRFPVSTPRTKEAYMYREMFQKHFPGESARNSVPGGPSIACSTPAAIEWDETFKKLASNVGGDNSGRAVAGVHNDAYGDALGVISGKVSAAKMGKAK